MKKYLFLLFLIFCKFAFAVDTYDGVKLKTPYIKVGENMYFDLAITVDKVIAVYEDWPDQIKSVSVLKYRTLLELIKTTKIS